MIGRKLAVTAAVMAGALALPGASGAAPPTPPAQDSVALTGQGVAGPFTIDTLNATSGPSGENPAGEASFRLTTEPAGGPVTCLAVRGNTATLNIRWASSPTSTTIMTITVVDDQPDTFDAFPFSRDPSDCSPAPPTLQRALTSGDITVVDAQPLPTTKNQCKNGGWKQFGFKNQGRCIRFV